MGNIATITTVVMDIGGSALVNQESVVSSLRVRTSAVSATPVKMTTVIAAILHSMRIRLLPTLPAT